MEAGFSENPDRKAAGIDMVIRGHEFGPVGEGGYPWR